MLRSSLLTRVCLFPATLLLIVSYPHHTNSTSELRRITNTGEEVLSLNPSLSGDGRFLAFESTASLAGAGGGNGFRALRADTSSNPADLVQMGISRAVAPAISQDGSHIAFASRDNPLGTNSDGNSEIFLYNGATLIQVTDTSPGEVSNRIINGNFQPSISDDGRFIAFSSNRDLTTQNVDGNFEIFVCDTVELSFFQLTNSSGIVGSSDAKISGNGVSIAYIRDNGTTPSVNRDLLLQNRLDLAPIRLLATDAQALALAYGRAISDDGARVVYTAQTATNSSQVFLSDGRNNTTRQITSLGTRADDVPLQATISGDGSRLAFATRRNVLGGNTDNSVELYTFDIPSTHFDRVTNAPSSATAEIVSSLNDDGSLIAFNFPRVLSGPVSSSELANNSEIYLAATAVRSAFGDLRILNAASLGHEPSDTEAVAPDSIAVGRGSALANSTEQSQRQPDGTFPLNVGGTTVTVNGRPTQIFFVSPTQVNFLVPAATEIGAAEVIVTNSEGFRSRGTVPALRAAPGVFTVSGDGLGEGVILDADTLQRGPFDPTSGNLRLTIFSTGVRSGTEAAVTARGQAFTIESVMASPDLPGLDEVHVLVPADLRGAGTIALVVRADGRESNPVETTFTGDPVRDVRINEMLADPPDGSAGDANDDGLRSSSEDEFVELVNAAEAVINISGWTVRTRAIAGTTETTRHTFAPGTLLVAGEALVLFGGGNIVSTNPIFGCAGVVRASTGGLSLTNAGLTVVVRDAAANLITQFGYGGTTGLEGDENQSLTRSPDITGNFIQHTSAAGANGRRFSPGLKVDGSPLRNCLGHLTSITISPLSAGIDVGESTQFIAQALDEFGRPLTGSVISFASDPTSVATVDSVTTDSTTGIATANVTGRNPGTSHITAQATDGATTITSNPATLTVNTPASMLSINNASISEGNSGTSTLSFTVSLSAPAPAGGVTFNIATEDDTGTVADNDYVAKSLVAQSIPAGTQVYTFIVSVNGDTNVEPNETFFVNVTNLSGATVTDGQGLGTIQNDDSPLLVITQIYGGGNNSGATFQNDFVEIFNRGTTSVNFAVTPYSVQYASASGDFSSGNKIDLNSGVVLPGQYFLVKLAGGTTNGAPLPIADANGSINMSATAGKVALVIGTTLLSGSGCPINSMVADLIGYGSANCAEGSATAVLSATRSARRTNACVDSNSNSADFSVVSNPAPPRNSVTAPAACP